MIPHPIMANQESNPQYHKALKAYEQDIAFQQSAEALELMDQVWIIEELTSHLSQKEYTLWFQRHPQQALVFDVVAAFADEVTGLSEFKISDHVQLLHREHYLQLLQSGQPLAEHDLAQVCRAFGINRRQPKP